MKGARLFRIFFLLTGYISASAQAQVGQQTNPDSALLHHRTLAILPLQIAVSASDFRRFREVNPAQVRREALRQGREAQALLGRHFAEQHFTVALQDTLQTLRLLTEAGVDLERLPDYDPQELCQVLGVDAVLIGRMHKIEPLNRETRPGNRGAQVPVGGFFVGVPQSGARHTATFSLYDGQTGEEVWQTTDETVNHNLYLAWTYAQHVSKYLRSVTHSMPYPRWGR